MSPSRAGRAARRGGSLPARLPLPAVPAPAVPAGCGGVSPAAGKPPRLPLGLPAPRPPGPGGEAPRSARPRQPRGAAPAPPRPIPSHPAPSHPVPFPVPGSGEGSADAAMSHGARVIRTGVSSGGPAAPPPVTVASSSAGSDAELMDGGYFRSCAGMLKVAQMISLLIGFISVNNSPWTDYSAYSFFQIVTMCDLVMILFFYIMHIFRVYRKLTCVSWPLAEFLHYLIGTILLLIGSIVAASKSYNITGLVAGATFGFLATILCVISMWSSYKVSCITQSTNASV
ncbi:CKLF-like MARVEL transmembrane domain-containing protein 7 [Motacilla alba alba]|nr:CKLF-like MARVEL transmembrane domain-containing protein 7 [Motacilla alba alba]